MNHHKSRIQIAALMIFVAVLLIGCASAFGETATFLPMEKSKYGTYEIWNNFKLPLISSKVAEYTLTDSSDSVINAYAKGTVILYDKGQLYSNIRFKSRIKELEDVDYKLFYNATGEETTENIIYKDVCEDVDRNKTIEKVCTQVEDKREKVTNPKEYMKLYEGEDLVPGIYRWEIDAKKPKPNYPIDWIVEAQGKELSNWAWWTGTWPYRQLVNVTGGITTLYNFTVYLNVTWNSKMQVDMSDVRFLNGSCLTATAFTELNYEKDYVLNSSSGGFWVMIPILNTGTNQFCMYYGNGAVATTSNGSTAWDGNYTFVGHFSEDLGTSVKDSKTENKTWGVIVGSTSWLGGYFGKSLNLTGGAYVKTGLYPYITTNYTLEAFDYMYGGATEPRTIISKQVGSTGVDMKYWNDATGSVDCSAGSATWSQQSSLFHVTDQWVNHVCTGEHGAPMGWVKGYTNKTWRLDTNGGGSGAAPGTQAIWTFGISSDLATRKMQGLLDEVRVSDIIRSSDYINRSYGNMNFSLFAFGAEEVIQTLNVTSVSPANGFTTTNNAITFNCSAYSTTGALNLTLIIDTLDNYTLTGGAGLNISLQLTQSLSEGSHTWACRGVDSSAIASSGTRTVIIDQTLPVVRIWYPLNSTQIISNTSLLPINITFNTSAFDTNLNACWWFNSTDMFPSSNECYQEQTNNSWPGDGTCNLNYSGSNTGNIWPSIAEMYKAGDGDWSTYGKPLHVSDYLDMIFYKPSYSAGAIFTYKVCNATNITLPSICYNLNPVTVRWTHFSNTYYTIECYGTDSLYHLLETQYNSTCADTFYEGAMRWKIPAKNIVSCNANVTTQGMNSGTYTLYYFANDTAGNIGSNQTTFNIYNASSSSNASTMKIIEGQNFSLWAFLTMSPNISISNVIAGFTWNNNNYSAGAPTYPYKDTALYNKTFTATAFPSWNGTVNWSWYSYSNFNYPNITGSQNYYSLFFAPCNESVTQDMLNLTFIDETTNLPMNATLDASAWSYTYGSATKTFSYTNASQNYLSYGFCIYPPFVPSITSTETLRYSQSEIATYPQRKMVYTNDNYFNSTLTTKKLYLLDSTHGNSITFQVISIGNQVIEGAYITVQRLIGGTTVTVASGYTDAAGQVTFFLNGNFEHIITVSKAGFLTQTQSITPTQAIYTITLGTSSNYFAYSNPLEGISYLAWPPSGLISDGMYNFTLEIYSRNLNIYNCSIYIYDSNHSTIGSSVDCNANYPLTGNGGKAGVMVNTTGIPWLYGSYFIATTNGTFIIEAGAQWKNVQINNTAYWTSIRSALNDSYNAPEWGDDSQTTDFSRIVFFFIFFGILLAIVNYYTGYDTAYPGAYIILMVFVVCILSLFNGISGPGWFYLNGVSNFAYFGSNFKQIINNLLLPAHFIMIGIIYIFTTLKRYQSG